MVCADEGVEEVHSSSASLALEVSGSPGRYPRVDGRISRQCIMNWVDVKTSVSRYVGVIYLVDTEQDS